jgi:hypothetical protein
MEFISFPKGWLHFSLTVDAVLALGAWAQYELSPITTHNPDWPPLGLFLILMKIMIFVTLMMASFGIGAGSLTLGMVCWRSLERNDSNNSWLSRMHNGIKLVISTLVCLIAVVIGTDCIDKWNFFSALVLFGGLQVSELLLWRRCLRWRYTRDRVSL